MRFLPEGGNIIYFFYGKDTFRSKKRLESLVSSLFSDPNDPNVAVFESNYDVSKMGMEVLSMPFLAQNRLIIIKNIFKSKFSDPEALIEVLEKKPESTIVVFYEEGEPDRRTVLFKRLKEENSEEFKELLGYELNRWVEAEVRNQGGEIGIREATFLSGILGNDLFLLKNEIAKLIAYEKKITIDNINLLIASTSEAGIFNLLDAISSKNKKLADRYLREILDSGENEMYVLTMIQKQVRNLALIFEKKKEGLRETEIASALKLHPYVVKKALMALNRINDLETIKRYYDLVTRAEFEIKSGQKEADIALELLVLDLSK